MLELDEGQLSRPVLRGRGGSNTSLLPGLSVSGSSQRGRVWARPDPAGGAWSVKRGAWGESIVASESEGREPALIEKRQNEANWNRSLITCYQKIKVDTIGVVYAKQTQFHVVESRRFKGWPCRA